MKNKRFILVLILAVCITASSFLLTGCNNDDPLLIVYLGDSIAEGIIGPTVLTERENNAYYGIIGIRNEYTFKNRAISGHMSKDLLEYIKLEDKGAQMTNSYLKMADVIHVSILGNDFLLNDVSKLLLDIVFDNDFSNIDAILTNSVANFAEIVSVLRSYNPNAVIFFQCVYNPLFVGSPIMNEKTRLLLEEKGVSVEETRECANEMLKRLNAIIKDYLAAHPGAFYVLDAQEEFDRIYKEDIVRGKNLIYTDGVHPSSEGHAVLADLTQEKLEELNLADGKQALANYKKMRKEQLERLYGYKNSPLNVKAAKKRIDKAKSCKEVTKVYFEEINGITPVYY